MDTPPPRIPIEHVLIGWCVDEHLKIYNLSVLDQREVLAGEEPDAFLWGACTHTAGACVAGWNAVNCASLILELLQSEYIHQQERYSTRAEFNLIDWAVDWAGNPYS